MGERRKKLSLLSKTRENALLGIKVVGMLYSAHTNGSVMALLEKRNHCVEGLMVMTFGSCPFFTQDPQGKPL